MAVSGAVAIAAAVVAIAAVVVVERFAVSCFDGGSE